MSGARSSARSTPHATVEVVKTPAKPGQTPTNRYVSMNLQEHHLRHLDELAAGVGLNRNQFVKMLWERMTAEDVQRIMDRR
jgi:hypothetical protein